MGGMSIADSVQSPIVSVPQQQEPTPAERAAAGDEQMQKQMIEAFCQESRMKPEWSKKCLIDQNWNYEVCFSIFLILKSNRLIEKLYVSDKVNYYFMGRFSCSLFYHSFYLCAS